MMLFDPYAALQEIAEQGRPAASIASFASNAADGCRKEADEAKEAAPRGEIPESGAPALRPAPEEYRHGFAVNGHPKTWTGRIVSLDDWRRLSAWDRHGPDGRHWNGATRQWERPGQGGGS